MKITKYICDKCGTELDNKEEVPFPDIHVVNGLDFCDKCYDVLVNMIQEWIDED